jgi:serine/threonine protein kinase
MGAEIGEGAVGSVYVVTKSNKKYALKVIREYRNPIIRNMVDQEIKSQKLFTGEEHIIRIYNNQYNNF